MCIESSRRDYLATFSCKKVLFSELKGPIFLNQENTIIESVKLQYLDQENIDLKQISIELICSIICIYLNEIHRMYYSI